MNLASHADVRTWGRNAWRTPKNVCEGGYNEWGSSFFSWPRWQHPCTLHAKSAWPALGRPTYSSFFRRFLFSHCLLNVEYKTIGVQKREFLSKKYYCCRTLEVVPKSYRPKGQPRNTRNEFPIRADFGNSRKHPIWRLKRGGKLTAKGAVLSPEKRDLRFCWRSLRFEVFLVLYSKQSFYKCLINLSCPAGRYYRKK